MGTPKRTTMTKMPSPKSCYTYEEDAEIRDHHPWCLLHQEHCRDSKGSTTLRVIAPMVMPEKKMQSDRVMVH